MMLSHQLECGTSICRQRPNASGNASRRRSNIEKDRIMKSPVASVAADTSALLAKLGVDKARCTGGPLAVHSPITGELIAQCQVQGAKEMSDSLARAVTAFAAW